jgi:hypothetical protein
MHLDFTPPIKVHIELEKTNSIFENPYRIEGKVLWLNGPEGPEVVRKVINAKGLQILRLT